MFDRNIPPSPWGSEDQIGAANRLTEESILSAIALARVGRVFDLSQSVSRSSPRHSVMLSPYFICLNHFPWASEKYEHDVNGARNGLGWAQERVEMDMHTGTHVDALGHATIGGVAYNNFPALDVYGNWGLMKLGIENVPPLITRGVLIDMPGFLGREMQSGEVITVENLQAALKWEEAEVQAGDIVLIRTGWAKYYEDEATFMSSCPGIGLDGARWLADLGVVAVGADQPAVEVWPAEDPENSFPVHQELLVKSGVLLIEQANLEELASERIYTFLTICLTPKFVGATGSPVRLIAVS